MPVICQHFTSKYFKISIINEPRERKQILKKVLLTVARVMTRKF